MKERNTPGLARVRAEEIAGTGAGGKRETGAECMAETGTKGMAETSAISAAREVVVGISMSATTPSCSKVSAIRGIDIQNKGRLPQRGDSNIYV